MNEIETFIDVGQVAKMLGLSIATIRKWVLIKFIPYRKIGRAVRFSAMEIQEWIQSKSSIPILQKTQDSEGGNK